MSLIAFLFACVAPEDAPLQSAPVDDSGEPGDTADTGLVDAYCSPAGLTARPFTEGGTGADFDMVAGDFTVETLAGDWNLRESFTGCDSYVFITYQADNANMANLLDSNIKRWLQDSPTNVHYFFMSLSTGAAAVQADMAAAKALVDVDVARLDDDEQAWWNTHIHYLTQNAKAVDGWFGDLATSYQRSLWGFGIDRAQNVREVGYWADALTGWEDWSLELVKYDVIYWNFEAARQERLDAETATVVRAFDAELASDGGWTGASIVQDVALPADIGSYDTLELDLTMACTGHPETTFCPAWDYLVYAYLCEPDDEAEDCRELGRFITTYWRPGRWTVDASAFLAAMQDGGDKRIRFYTTQTYAITLDLRFSNRGKGAVPFAMEPLWTGGAFNETYNDGHLPLTVTAPAGATKAEIVAIISGHGFADDRANCAEFCNHQHEFVANGGTAHLEEYTMAGTSDGCAEQVAIGTVPNQLGTWPYGRGGWCPGKEVPPWTADITADIDLAGENTLSYRGLFEGQPYVPDYLPDDTRSWFGGRIDMNAYIVWSR